MDININGRNINDLLLMEDGDIRNFLDNPNVTQRQLLQLDQEIDNIIPMMPNSVIKLNTIQNIIEGILMLRILRRQYATFNVTKPRAKSRKPRAKSRKPRAKSRKPRAKSRKPRAKSRKLRK